VNDAPSVATSVDPAQTTVINTVEPLDNATVVDLSPEDNAQLAGSTDEVATSDLQNQYLRLAADFDNFRKRSHTERDQARRYGIESVLQALIPVLDNLDRASNSLNEQSDPRFLYQSFRMIYTQLLEGFGNVGLKKLTVLGEAFDPTRHEAVNQTDSTEHPENTVIAELQGGFSLLDKGDEMILRPAMVTVSTLPASPASESPTIPVTSVPSNPFFKAGSHPVSDLSDSISTPTGGQ
jgi:molecular chaperone GrpE